MTFNPLPEEQKDPELVSSLQEIYAMKSQDREALARIEARLSLLSPMETQAPPASLHNEFPQRLNGHPRSKKGWTFLSTIAALFVVALVTGAILFPFLFMKSRSTVINQPTATSQQTPFPILSRTLLGRGTRLDGSYTRGFHMVSEKVGWATEPGSLFRTTDGGKTWKEITLPQELQGSAEPFWIDVFDSDMVLLQPYKAAGAGMTRLYFYHTVDAGATWQRFNWPTTPEVTQDGYGTFDTTFLNHKRGWVLVNRGTGLSGTPQSIAQTLFHTNDGGKTWQEVALLPLKYLGYNLFFSDTQTGWILTPIDSQNADPDNPSTYPQALYVTHDGGKTWKQQSLPDRLQSPTKPSRLGGLTFMNDSEGYLFASFEKGDGISEADYYLYRTYDGGKTWQKDDALLPSVFPDFQIVDATHILARGIDFTDDPRKSYYLLTLTDGQWVKTSGVIAGVKDATVEFINTQTAVALETTDESSPNVYRSDDGGKTWQKISTLPVGA